jgi:hypothetical protein
MVRPHFLRVVQALSFVSGFGPVAVVTGATLLGCGSSDGGRVFGASTCPDANECGGGVHVSPDAAFDSAGIITGTLPACEVNDAGQCIDGAVVGGGIGVPPDAGHDATILGGPLSPPELFA